MKKRIVSMVLCVLMLLTLLPVTALAEALPTAAETEANWVELNETNFPDANFRAYLEEDFSTIISDGKINANGVTNIYCSSRRIKSLDGIKRFTALKDLYCSYNRLTELDVSANTNLVELDCQYQLGDGLATLNVSGCTKLKYLDFHHNRIAELDISTNTELTSLFCNSNQLTGELDISTNTKLETLHCEENGITTLNVSKHAELEGLYCQSNQLTKLDVSENAELTYLQCFENLLTGTLDVSNNTKLNELFCYDNQLTGTLDVSNCPELTNLDCSNNRLTELKVSSADLRTLNCGQNQLTTLDVSASTVLTNLNCNDNRLTSLTVGSKPNLEGFECANNYLTEVDASGCSAETLKKLACSEMNVETLTVKVPGRNNLMLTTVGVDAENVTILLNGEKQTGPAIAGRLMGFRGEAYLWLSDAEDNRLCGTFANTFNGGEYRFDAAPVKDGTYTIGAYEWETSPTPETEITITVANGVVVGSTLVIEPGVGNVNGDSDGTIDITDVQALYAYLTSGTMEGSNKWNQYTFEKYADVNGDESVDVYDLQYLYEYVSTK